MCKTFLVLTTCFCAVCRQAGSAKILEKNVSFRQILEQVEEFTIPRYYLVWRQKSNENGLTSQIEVSPVFMPLQNFLSDSSNNVMI